MLKQKTLVSEYELPIKIEPQKEGGYVARCTEWSNCYAQGDTIDEAVIEITGVAQAMIDIYREEGLKIPLKKQVEKSLANSFTVPVIVAA